MKRLLFIIASVLLLVSLSACATENFVLVYYETYELMSAELPFTVKKVPEEENYIIFGSMDGSLGQIDYEILSDGEPEGKLTYRMAKLDYSKKFAEEFGCLGVSGVSGTATSTERLGSYTVSYYTKDNVAVAVWDEDDYAYSLVYRLDDTEGFATIDKVRECAIALIATRK